MFFNPVNKMKTIRFTIEKFYDSHPQANDTPKCSYYFDNLFTTLVFFKNYINLSKIN